MIIILQELEIPPYTVATSQRTCINVHVYIYMYMYSVHVHVYVFLILIIHVNWRSCVPYSNTQQDIPQGVIQMCYNKEAPLYHH